jgi:hypothetical protein
MSSPPKAASVFPNGIPSDDPFGLSNDQEAPHFYQSLPEIDEDSNKENISDAELALLRLNDTFPDSTLELNEIASSEDEEETHKKVLEYVCKLNDISHELLAAVEKVDQLDKTYLKVLTKLDTSNILFSVDADDKKKSDYSRKRVIFPEGFEDGIQIQLVNMKRLWMKLIERRMADFTQITGSSKF